MLQLIKLALPACLVIYPGASYAVDHTAIAAAVDGAFVPLIKEHDVPGLAVGVSINGEHHFFNYGVSSLDGGEPVTEHTIFELGSVSKTFTAALGGYALAQGKLSLEHTPSRYIPELAGAPIDNATLAHLGTYTAGGLPLQFPEGITSDDEALSYLAAWQADAAPGQIRRYSNPSIGFFGHLTARALGGEFAELLDEEIFDALDLDHTHVRVPENHEALYAWGYDAENRPIRVNPGPFDDEAYGVKSSAADVIAFVDANIRPETLQRDLREAIEATQMPYFRIGPMVQGLGWEQMPYPLTAEELLAGNSLTLAMEPNPAASVNEGTGETVLFNKTGSTNGFGAYVAFVPEEDMGVVMLANKNVFMPARIHAVHAVLEALAAQN
ncbi:class C beta-lactamase [Pelagibacterium sp. H642]|uniref:class C beta-lactamase n=1 Tax=Pelagibacterium sp. H642 TaxID=1881069 RepID=UPI0028152697|nr:class C beta-lactamase [Pelagibacterium sp. H642]WMT92808.1 beta-lactamase [Pelagibacterium sp. H642]